MGAATVVPIATEHSRHLMLLAYFSHHKCATQWMKAILADVCELIGRTPSVHNNARSFDRDLPGSIADPESTFLMYLNAERRWVRQLRNYRGFHVVRDPRDILVSAYFSHLHSHPEYGDLADYRHQLQQIGKSEGIFLEIERREKQFLAMGRWNYRLGNVLEVKMENLITEPMTKTVEILDFLRIEIDNADVSKILERHDFSVKAGRAPGTEDVTSHYRRGIAGDWVNHLDERHVDAFKERFNDVLIKLGYEASPDWDLSTRSDLTP